MESLQFVTRLNFSSFFSQQLHQVMQYFNVQVYMLSTSKQVKQKKSCKEIFKPQKSFSTRNGHTHIIPYGHQYSKAKQKAYERYKEIYPMQDKENLYPMSKTPYIGFYFMKGYRQDTNCLRDSDSVNISQPVKCSDKIISNILKKYLDRKQQAQIKENNMLPKIEHSASMINPTNGTSIYIKHRKQTYTRVLTEYQEGEPLKPKAVTKIVNDIA